MSKRGEECQDRPPCPLLLTNVTFEQQLLLCDHATIAAYQGRHAGHGRLAVL